jgi:hypothetical protein
MAHNRAAELWEQDHVFPDVLETVAAVVKRTTAKAPR